MPTDPATERTMTDEALGELFDAAREKQDRRVAMFSYRPWCDLPPQAKANVRIFAESIAALAASRVDTAEVMPRTARKDGLNARAEYEPDARGTFHVQAWYDTREAAQAAYSAITNGRREYPAPAPRECVPVKPSVVSWHEGGWCKYDLADETGKVVGHVDGERAFYPLGTLLGRYITGNFAKKAVEQAFAAEVGQ